MREPTRLTRFLRSSGLLLLGFASFAVSALFADDVVGRHLDEGLRSLAILVGLVGFVSSSQHAIRILWPKLDELWREDDSRKRPGNGRIVALSLAILGLAAPAFAQQERFATPARPPRPAAARPTRVRPRPDSSVDRSEELPERSWRL
jgi:hypothetical protein